MFELPEMVNLARQFNESLYGKKIHKGCLGNSPHKFVWYNHCQEEFENLTKGKVMGTTHARGKWLFADLNPGYVMVFGECGGKLLYHSPGQRLPAKYHLLLEYEDGSKPAKSRTGSTSRTCDLHQSIQSLPSIISPT
jgi:formamidopyrimidine-DNA glycosylase